MSELEILIRLTNELERLNGRLEETYAEEDSVMRKRLENQNEPIDNGRRFTLSEIEKIFKFNDSQCANILGVSEDEFLAWKNGEKTFPVDKGVKLAEELNFDPVRVRWPVCKG